LVAVSSAGVTPFLGKGDGSFTPGAPYPIGGGDFGFGAVLGDFNNDGKLDVAVTAFAPNGPAGTVNILLGNGDGTFQPALRSPVRNENGLSFIAAGDFNHDGKLDLVGLTYLARGSAAAPIEVLLGKGDGTFQSPVDYPVAQLSWSITVADFNRDGHLDLAVTNAGDEFNPGHTVSVYLGKGDGTFGSATHFQTDLMPVGIVAADFNGDGKVDLATANFVSGTVSVLLGKGDGTFASQASYPTSHPYDPQYLAAIKFGTEGSSLVSIGLAGMFTLVNKGNGTFRTAEGYSPGGGGNIVVADFNGDDHADVAVSAGDNTSTIGPGIAVLLGKGEGAFAASRAYVAVPSFVSVALGDFNGDGNLDMAAGGLDSAILGILLGNGKGGFSSPVNQYTVSDSITGIAVGDLNGDGKLDLVLTLFAGHVQILLGNGDGSFSMAGSYSLYKLSPPTFGYIALADFNGDGALDIAVTSPGITGTPGAVSILLGNGNGTFQPAVPYAIETSTAGTDVLEGIAVGDFDGDGKRDFAVGDNVLGTLRTFLGNGDGTFRAGPQTPVQPYMNSIAAADFNGDGNLDLAVGNNAIQILLGNGDGSFRQGTTLNIPGGWLTAADFNRDGKVDLVTFVGNLQMRFLPGHGDGTFGAEPASFTSLGPYQFALGDLNGDGLPDLVTAGDEGGATTVLLNRCSRN
jgi:hypothetical protein